MTTLQLRITDQDMLWRIVQTIVDELWDALEEYRSTDHVALEDFACVDRIILERLNKSVTRYTPCGRDARCHSPLKCIIPSGSERAASRVEHTKAREPHVLLFETPQDFDRFVQGIEEE